MTFHSLAFGTVGVDFSPYYENIFMHTLRQVKDGNRSVSRRCQLLLSSCFKNSMVDLVIRLDYYMWRDFSSLGGLCNPLPNFKAPNRDNFAIIELFAEGKFCFALLTANPTYVCFVSIIDQSFLDPVYATKLESDQLCEHGRKFLWFEMA